MFGFTTPILISLSHLSLDDKTAVVCLDTEWFPPFPETKQLKYIPRAGKLSRGNFQSTGFAEFTKCFVIDNHGAKIKPDLVEVSTFVIYSWDLIEQMLKECDFYHLTTLVYCKNSLEIHLQFQQAYYSIFSLMFQPHPCHGVSLF